MNEPSTEIQIVIPKIQQVLRISPSHLPVKISYNGKEYLIKQTKNGKLIMN